MAEVWTLTEMDLPPEGEVVDTMSRAGLRQNLKLWRGLWFFPDGSMYVYYVPACWRPLGPKKVSDG